MEKTKQEIENYINSNLDRIIKKRKSSQGKLHNVRLWVNDLADFSENLDQNVKQIISNNGITKVDSINELILFARTVWNEKTKRF